MDIGHHRTCVLCIGRRVPIHCTIREVPLLLSPVRHDALSILLTNMENLWPQLNPTAIALRRLSTHSLSLLHHGESSLGLMARGSRRSAVLICALQEKRSPLPFPCQCLQGCDCCPVASIHRGQRVGGQNFGGRCGKAGGPGLSLGSPRGLDVELSTPGVVL